MTNSTPDSWRLGLERMQADGGGVYEVRLFDGVDLAALAVCGAFGDARAKASLRALKTFAEKVGRARRGETPLCLTCDARLGRRVRLALMGTLHAHGGDIREIIVFGLCSGCSGRFNGTEALQSAVFAGLRQLFTDLRPLSAPVVMQIGHA